LVAEQVPYIFPAFVFVAEKLGTIPLMPTLPEVFKLIVTIDASAPSAKMGLVPLILEVVLFG
jgi:hypothetical protein